MKEPPVFFDGEQANVILTRWKTVIPEAGWYLFASAIMPNHFHVVLASPTGFTKEDYLRTLKARASFSLNKKYGKRIWWTDSGSVRYCFDEHLLDTRIEYVMKQKNPLVVWRNPEEFNLR
jgi:REP element-mobilizing transposase RayT